MVKFNKLLVDSDSNTLIIDISIPRESYYKDVFLDSVIIDNQDTYIGTGVSSTPVYEYEVAEDINVKHLKLTIKEVELNCSLNSLFFVYVRTRGTYAADTPCGCDEITSMASVTNMKPFYDNMMKYIRELSSSCDIPRGFIDQFLITEALEVAIRTRNYPYAIQLWKNHNKSTNIIRRGGCGCYGNIGTT